MPLKNVTLNMAEDERGALCHCGKRFSRSGLVVHLEEPFGLPTGALQYKPPTPSEGDVVFGDARTDWGTANRIWTQDANDSSVRLSLGMMRRRLTANSLKVDGHAHLFFLVWDTLRDSELYSRAAHHPKHGNSRTEQDGDAHCPGDARRGTVSNHCQLHCVCALLHGCRRQTAAVTDAFAEVAQLAVQIDEVGPLPLLHSAPGVANAVPGIPTPSLIPSLWRGPVARSSRCSSWAAVSACTRPIPFLRSCEDNRWCCRTKSGSCSDMESAPCIRHICD